MFEVFTWRVSDCEELVGVLLEGYMTVKDSVGEVNHTTESATDIFYLMILKRDSCDPIQIFGLVWLF